MPIGHQSGARCGPFFLPVAEGFFCLRACCVLSDGSYLAELLLSKGYHVHGIIRRSSSFNTGRVDHLYKDLHSNGARFFLHYGDLTDSTNLVNIVGTIRPDEIYNLAAQSHVAVSFEMAEVRAQNKQGGVRPALSGAFCLVLRTFRFLYGFSRFCVIYFRIFVSVYSTPATSTVLAPCVCWMPSARLVWPDTLASTKVRRNTTEFFLFYFFRVFLLCCPTALLI
jgi:hypothetical protein